ncbi:MAG: LysR family transcriptional regulator [Pseudomonadota bacterium]
MICMLGPSAASTLDIDALRAFLAVADSGGVTSAAERVGRTPAAVSMQLKKLEEILGRPLFDRRPRGMALTRDGEQLRSYARRILTIHTEAVAAFRAPALSGSVRVGLIDDFGGVQLTEALSAFSRIHPDVEVSVALGPTEDLFKRLERGELDFSMLTPGCATPWLTEDALIHEEPLVWTGLCGGCAHERDVLPVALAASGCAWRKQAIEALDRSGRAYRIAYTSEYYIGQKAAISADLAIAPLPRSIVEPEFVVLGPEHGLPTLGTSRIALRWAGPDHRTPAAEALANELIAGFGSAPSLAVA